MNEDEMFNDENDETVPIVGAGVSRDNEFFSFADCGEHIIAKQAIGIPVLGGKIFVGYNQYKFPAIFKERLVKHFNGSPVKCHCGCGKLRNPSPEDFYTHKVTEKGRTLIEKAFFYENSN